MPSPKPRAKGQLELTAFEHGHEAAVAEMFGGAHGAIGLFAVAYHLLIYVADGYDEYAAWLELLHELWGQEGCTAGDEYAVEEIVDLGEPFVSVAEVAVGAVAEAGEERFGFGIEPFLAFDGIYFGTHGAQHGGLIAGTGAYLEHFHAGLYLEKLCLECHGRGLRDGLFADDGECHIVVGMGFEGGVEEEMAGYLIHGLEHSFVADLGTQLFYHLAAEPFVEEGVLHGGRGYSSSEACQPWATRSMVVFWGVTITMGEPSGVIWPMMCISLLSFIFS